MRQLPAIVETRPQPLLLDSFKTTTTVLSMRKIHHHGDLFVNYLMARREVFILQKGWDLPEADGMEFDQYDTPLARWIVIHQDNRILAGVRIAPTTARCGVHSYMLRDAQLGLIQGVPSDSLFDAAPVSPTIWEATRLFVSENVPSRHRLLVQRRLMEGMASAARSMGVDEVIGIVPAVFRRWLKRIGMAARAVGPVMFIDGELVQAAIMNMKDVAGSSARSGARPTEDARVIAST